MVLAIGRSGVVVVSRYELACMCRQQQEFVLASAVGPKVPSPKCKSLEKGDRVPLVAVLLEDHMGRALSLSLIHI